MKKVALILISLQFFIGLNQAAINCKTWPIRQNGTIYITSDDRSFYIICDGLVYNGNNECQLRHWNRRNGVEYTYSSNEKFILELRGGPTYSYYVEIIQDWYPVNASNNLHSICKIKAVPRFQERQDSVDDTIYLDIITVGSEKKVRKDRPENDLAIYI